MVKDGEWGKTANGEWRMANGKMPRMANSEWRMVDAGTERACA
jgi:hypothetical protein